MDLSKNFGKEIPSRNLREKSRGGGANIHFFIRSQNSEGKITIFTVLKCGKGRNHYENHDLGHNH